MKKMNISSIESINNGSMKRYEKEIWVYIELNEDGIVIDVSFELLTEARRLASFTASTVSAIIIGACIDEQINQIKEYDVDDIVVVRNYKNSLINQQQYPDLIKVIVDKYKPMIILFPATLNGRNIAAGTAVKLNTGLTADCTSLDIDKETGLLLQTRPALDGTILASIISKSFPQMATVRPNVIVAKKAAACRNTRMVFIDICMEHKNMIHTVKKEILNNIRSDLQKADIVIAAGRGIIEPENMELIHKFATLINASVGVTRPLVDMGWVSNEYQIGQTGKIIKPKIYFAFGISGTIQHLIGIHEKSQIIAINSDLNAPIFHYATYGIVGDATRALKIFIKEFNK